MSYIENVEEFLRAVEPFTIVPPDRYSTREPNAYRRVFEIRFTHPTIRETFKGIWKDRVYFLPGGDRDSYEDENGEEASAGITSIIVAAINLSLYLGASAERINQRIEEFSLCEGRNKRLRRFVGWMKDRRIIYMSSSTVCRD